VKRKDKDLVAQVLAKVINNMEVMDDHVRERSEDWRLSMDLDTFVQLTKIAEELLSHA
jgi:hypothetical protein